jgi:hypothetical protein
MRLPLFILLAIFSGCRFGVDGLAQQGSPDAAVDLAGADAARDGATPRLDAGDAATGGLLTGSVVVTPTPLTIALTTEGATDWTHWGLVSAASFDHKQTGGGEISNFTSVMGGPVAQNGNYLLGFTWNDGTPDPNANNTQTGVYVSGHGEGFHIVVLADTTTRTFRLYGGGQQSTCTLTAHLSDGSAPDLVQTGSDPGALFYRTITIQYHAASAGQTLQIYWVVTSPSGFAHVQSASLQ